MMYSAALRLQDSPLAAAEQAFLRLAVSRARILRDCGQQIATGQNTTEATDRIAAIAHQLTGTAETLGFIEIGLIAEELDHHCTTTKDFPQISRLLGALLDQLSALAR
jgi:HPt (histidine-containing phosphotransfer) domain-containing protein